MSLMDYGASVNATVIFQMLGYDAEYAHGETVVPVRISPQGKSQDGNEYMLASLDSRYEEIWIRVSDLIVDGKSFFPEQNDTISYSDGFSEKKHKVVKPDSDTPVFRYEDGCNSIIKIMTVLLK